MVRLNLACYEPKKKKKKEKEKEKEKKKKFGLSHWVKDMMWNLLSGGGSCATVRQVSIMAYFLFMVLFCKKNIS